MKTFQSFSNRLNGKSMGGFALSQTCASIAAIAAMFYYVIPASTEIATGAAATHNASTLNRALACYKAAGGMVKGNTSCSDVVGKLSSDESVSAGAIISGPFIELHGNPIFGHDGWRVVYEDGRFRATDLPGKLGVASF